MTNVQTTLTVASAATFPSSGQFRVLVEDEIMLVTDVSGTTFTVTRGHEDTTAVTHASSAPVALVLTAGSISEYIRDFANPQLGGHPAYTLTDKSGNVLTKSSFTEQNFGSATATDTVGGGILFEKDSQASSDSVSLLTKAAPSGSTWKVTAAFAPNLLTDNGDFPTMGLVVQDDSDTDFYFFQQYCSNGPQQLIVQHIDGPTAGVNATIDDIRYWSGGCPYTWLQIELEATDLVFRISSDGVNFIEFCRDGKNDLLTDLDSVGFAMSNFGNGYAISTTLVSWKEE